MLKDFFSKISRNINCVKYWRKKGVVIGNNTRITTSVVFGTEPFLVEIGNNCNITDDVEFITHDGGCFVLRNLFEELSDIDCFKGKIVVGNNVYIGNHAAIMPGVKIGNNCIIGYGTIVTKDIPDNSVVVGVPGKVIENIDEYAKKNSSFFLRTKKMKSKDKMDYLRNYFLH